MVDQARIAELSERIAQEFQPERIILFGSYAYGQPHPDSDVDVLARRPEDTARRYAEGDPLIREALDHGKVLYECHR